MSRHDIRLRRSQMTSRRIERHKNYDALMRKHQRASWAKWVYRIVVGLLIALLAVYAFMYFL